MNVDRRSSDRIDPKVWDRYDMRMAIARRDVAAIFRLLQKFGVAQRRIAILTGQSQSEISEIIGGRTVLAYDLLLRICEGLGIDRGDMGLAFNARTAALLESAGDGLPHDVDVDDSEEEPRRTLAHWAQVTVGAARLDPETWWQPFARATAPIPAVIESAEVERLVQVTLQFREMDHQYGGGACRDAVVAHVQAAQQMLRSQYTEAVANGLYTALADLHTVAGWACFDTGLYVPARLHYNRALEQARFANQPSLVAKVLYCTGHLQLWRAHPDEALRLFQLGQTAALEAGSHLAASMLAASEARAYAVLGDADQALAALARAGMENAKAGIADIPSWLGFFDFAELQSSIATTYAALAPTAERTAIASEGLQVALALRDSSATRSQALDTITLAEVYFADGDIDQAIKVAQLALELNEQIRSGRVTVRLAHLRTASQTYRVHPEVQALLDQVDAAADVELVDRSPTA